MQDALHIEEYRAAHGREIRLPRLPRITAQVQPQVQHMTPEGLHVFLRGYALLPVIAGAHGAVALGPVVVHVFTEALND